MKAKKVILFAVVLICGCQISFGQLTAKVEERFELTSIAARLAGFSEYCTCRIPDYASNIDDYFSPYGNHQLLSFLRSVRESHRIAYNCISSVAYALEIRDGEIALRSIYDLNNADDINEIDPRWDKQSLSRYIELLNEFYRESDFHKFYEQHLPLYATATEQMNNILLNLDCGWFERFYGAPFGEPSVYVSLSNGPSNYALVSPEEDYGILIGCDSDENQMPAFSRSTFGLIIHEINHNFANPLAFEFASEMDAAAELIAPHVEELLARGAYSKRAILPEWLTRLGSVMYFEEHNPLAVPFEIINDANVGIIWQQRAFDFMSNFLANREQYEYFGDFMPQLIAFFNYTADNIEKVAFEYENREPYVVNVYPVPEGGLDITKDTVEIIVSFSEQMNTNAQGVRLNGRNLDALNAIEVPQDWEVGEWRDNKTYTIRLKSDWIRLGEVTGITFNHNYMQSAAGYSMQNDYTITYPNL